MKKEEFKEFVKKNPKLISYVKSGEMTWQKFYEMYDIYGESNEVWNEYLDKKEENKIVNKIVSTGISGLTLSEVVNFIKNVDLDNLQESINNVRRVLGVVQDFSNKSKNEEVNTYKPRPLYRHFED